MKIYSILVLFLWLLTFSMNGQVLINEVASSNNRFLKDENGDYPDWIELYNPTNSKINIKNWSLTDSKKSNRWIFPEHEMQPQSYFLIFASGKDRKPTETSSSVNHWETVVFEDDMWSYFVGDQEPPLDWKSPTFDVSTFPKGKGGFGYGDSDDNTVLNNPTLSVYYRTEFIIHELTMISKIILSMDYDDSFIAYVNGVEVARNNVDGKIVAYNNYSKTDHEALMYSGGKPEMFELDIQNLKAILVQGKNVLAIQINNVAANSSDLSGRTWLHLGLNTNAKLYRENPTWFDINPDPEINDTWHTNFKLSRNERLELYNDLEVLTDSIRIISELNNTNARIPDGGPWCILESPSPVKSNGIFCLDSYSEFPTLSHPPGFYNNSISVSVSGINCRYTTDGSDPSNNSSVYTTPILINKTTVLKVRSFENGKLPSRVLTGIYFINETTHLPVVSISTAPRNLFNDGTNGPAVYDKARGFTQSEKTGCHIQYFDINRNLWFDENASLTPVGNYSLDFGQKSLQFVFDEDWGAIEEEVTNIFFKDKPNIKSIHGFRIRNLDDDATSTRMRDVISNRMGVNTNSGAAAYQNVAVFINGKYWGHYAAREMLDKYFMRDNYQANPDSVNMVKTSYSIKPDYYPEEGNSTTFFTISDYIIQSDLSIEDNYKKVLEQIDIENWVDYYANQIYNNNQDWYPSEYFNNTRLAECKDPKVKWKYILWDMGVSQGNYAGVFDDLLKNCLDNPRVPNRYTDMMKSLLKNSKFKNYFINRFADLLNENWLTPRINKMIDDNVVEMASEIVKDHKRWNSVDSSSWRSNVQALKQWHAQRPSIQRTHIQNYFKLTKQVEVTLEVFPKEAGVIKISSIIPESLPWKGIYFNGNPVNITAIANPGYTFTHWTANGIIVDTNQINLYLDISKNSNFKANFNGSPQAVDIEISEINYNSDSTISSGDWIELHNKANFDLDISNYTIYDSQVANAYKIPSNTIIKSREYLVLCSDVDKFKLRNPLVKNFIGPIGFDLSNKGESINVLNRTNQLIIAMNYADSLNWPCTADGYGRTLELKSEGADPNKPESWFDGCMGGSPGTAYKPCQSSILITEINYKSSSQKDAGDWVELYNNTATDINIGNWKIGDKGSNIFNIPINTNLPANQYLVISQDLVKFKSIFPKVTKVIGSTQFGFDGNGDVVTIYNDKSELVFSICYDDSDPFPKGPDGGGYTLELKDYGGNVNDGSNWFAGCPGGSPGNKYDPACGSTGVSDRSGNEINLFPNPVTDWLIIETSSEYLFNLEIQNLEGKLVQRKLNIKGSAKIDLSNNDPGFYMVLITREDKLKNRFPIVKI